MNVEGLEKMEPNQELDLRDPEKKKENTWKKFFDEKSFSFSFHPMNRILSQRENYSDHH